MKLVTWCSVEVTDVWCVAQICVVWFRRRQVWRHLFHLWLNLLQRTPRSFVVIRIVVFVVSRASGRLDSDFAWFGGRPPRGSLLVCFYYWLDGWSWLFGTRFGCRNGFAGRSYLRGWLVVCWGDFLWRQPLLHESMLVITISCWCFWVVEVFRVFGGCVSHCVWYFSLWLVSCLHLIAYHVYRLTFCVLVSGGPVIFASRSRVGG